jgi:hypothetical protein
MVIVPCSMKTLAGVALGLSRSLVERAADVMLKEHRRLVLVPRETPMSLPALKNMVSCAEAGAVILPAMPAFYQQPEDDRRSGGFVAGKILNGLGFEQQLFPPWEGSGRVPHEVTFPRQKSPRASAACLMRSRGATTRSITCSVPVSTSGGGASSSRPSR